MIPPEALSVGVILNTLPETPEYSEIKQKWDMAEGMLSGQEGRIPTMLDSQFSYTQMRKRKICVISDGHAGTFDPDPQPGERIYTSVTNHMSRCEQYTDMVDLGDVVLDFSAIAQKIREIRRGINKQDDVRRHHAHLLVHVGL